MKKSNRAQRVRLIASKTVPDGVAWGSYPTMTGTNSNSTASQSYNVMVHSCTPASFKGIMFLCSEKMFEEEQGAGYGPELSALANGWKAKFGGEDPHFFYTIPDQSLAPKVTRSNSIKGKSTAVEIDQWTEVTELLDTILREAYR